MNPYIFLFLGFLLLFGGGHLLINSVIALSQKLRVKPLFLSIIVLGFMTSSPEWFVSFLSACDGISWMPNFISSLFSFCKQNSSVAVGNVMGSNLANFLLILCLTGLFCSIKNIDTQVSKFDLPCLLGFSLLLGVLGYDGQISFVDGFICSVVFVSYLVLIFRKRKQQKNSPQEEIKDVSLSLPLACLLLVAGFVCLFVGSNFAIDSSIEIAHQLGFSEKFVGIFMLSVGTSMPELVTCLVAALKKEVDMLVGGIVGSNIFNTLFILGSVSLIQPLMVSSDLYWDYLVVLLASLSLWVVILFFKRLPFWFCVLALLSYSFYIFQLA